MRSPETTRRAAVALLLLAAVAFTALAAWSLAARSAIPSRIDGTVTSIETRHEKHPGVDDVWIVSVDGEPRQLDAALAQALSVGDHVAKERWQTHLEVDGEEHALRLSHDCRAMLLLAPVVLLVATGLALPRRRPANGPLSPGTSPTGR